MPVKYEGIVRPFGFEDADVDPRRSYRIVNGHINAPFRSEDEPGAIANRQWLRIVVAQGGVACMGVKVDLQEVFATPRYRARHPYDTEEWLTEGPNAIEFEATVNHERLARPVEAEGVHFPGGRSDVPGYLYVPSPEEFSVLSATLGLPEAHTPIAS